MQAGIPLLDDYANLKTYICVALEANSRYAAIHCSYWAYWEGGPCIKINFVLLKFIWLSEIHWVSALSGLMCALRAQLRGAPVLARATAASAGSNG